MRAKEEDRVEADPQEAALWKEMQDQGFFFNVRGEKGNPMAGRWQRHLKSNPAAQEEFGRALKGVAQKRVNGHWRSHFGRSKDGGNNHPLTTL